MKILQNIMKCFIIIILIFSFAVNAFAAVVSDNDGSAFITKAEFDSLKNNFQSQIDTYNQGIDSKIDTAIASYLAGISLSYDSTNLYDTYCSNAGGRPIWIKSFNTGTTSFTTDVKAETTLHESVKSVGNIQFKFGLYSYAYNDARAVFAVYAGTQPTTNTSAGAGGSLKNCLVSSQTTAYMSADQTVWGVYASASGSPTFSSYNTENKSMIQNLDLQTGSGSIWESQTIGERTFLKYYNTSYYLKHNISSHFHSYFDKSSLADSSEQDYYLADNKRGYDGNYGAMSCDLSNTGLGKSTAGTKYGDGNLTNVGKYAEITSSLYKVNDGNNYLNTLFSITSDSTISVVDELYQGVNDSVQTVTVPDGTWTDIYYGSASIKKQTNTVKGSSFTYNRLKVSPNRKSITSYCNMPASSTAGVDVYNGGGMPILKTNEDSRKDKIKIKLTATSNDTCHVKISDKQFVLGAFAADANKLYEGDITANASATEITITTPKSGIVWLFLQNTTNNDAVTIDELTISK